MTIFDVRTNAVAMLFTVGMRRFQGEAALHF
jgi:hypothetical protein